MTRIIYFDHFASASEFYRLMPLDYLKNKNFTITRSTEREISAHLLNLYDVIILSRPTTELHLNIIKLARDMDKRIVGDYDDDVLHLPETNPMHGHYEGDKRYALKCIALCDEVWVATEAIKNSFRLYNKNIHIIPNAHNDTVSPVEHKRLFPEKKTVMWRGGGSHIADIYHPPVTEWIVSLINKNKKWEFYWLGQKFEFIEYRVKHGNFFYTSGASTVQFYKLMHELNPMVFFYPLSNNLFNRGKSNCSLIESCYSGAAYFGNTDLPEFNKPGVKPLKELPYMLNGNHDDELKKMNDESWRFIKDELLLSNVNRKRERRLMEVIR